MKLTSLLHAPGFIITVNPVAHFLNSKKEIKMELTVDNQVKLIVAKHTKLPLLQIQNDMFIQDLKMDKLDKLELFYELEDTFQIEFHVPIWEVSFENQFKNIDNLITMVELLEQKNGMFDDAID